MVEALLTIALIFGVGVGLIKGSLLSGVGGAIIGVVLALLFFAFYDDKPKKK